VADGEHDGASQGVRRRMSGLVVDEDQAEEGVVGASKAMGQQAQ
jgi:hypothetical protein